MSGFKISNKGQIEFYLIDRFGKDGFESEYKFHDVRKYRFDWALPQYKIAIEYEGLGPNFKNPNNQASKKQSNNKTETISASDFRSLMAGGAAASNKSRHTTGKGYTEDCNKYNLAQVCGWLVLRFTAMNVEKLSEFVEQAVIQRS